MKLASRLKAVQVKRDGDKPIVVQITAQMEVGDEKQGGRKRGEGSKYEMGVWACLYVICFML